MSKSHCRPAPGFTVMEVMIFVAVIMICLGGLQSCIGDQMVRTRVSEALTVAFSAKRAITMTCMEDPGIADLKSRKIGFHLEPSIYVGDISLGGSCDTPVIILETLNTGLVVDPTIRLTGERLGKTGRMKWGCTTDDPTVDIDIVCHT